MKTRKILKKTMETAMIFLIIAGMIFGITACGESSNGADPTEEPGQPEETTGQIKDVELASLLQIAVDAYDIEILPELSYYHSAADEESDSYMDSEYAGYIFYKDPDAEMTVFTNLEGFAMAIPTGKRVFEIDILKVKSSDDIEAAKALLQARFDVKNDGGIANYTPEENPYLQATEIYNIDNYVIMLSTVDNSIAKNAIKAEVDK